MFNKFQQQLHYSILTPIKNEPLILTLAIPTMLMTIGMGMAAPLLPLLVKSYGLSTVMVGTVISSFALARVFSNIPAGFLTQSKGAKLTLILGGFFAGLGNLLIGFTNEYSTLIVFRFIAGIGTAMYITSALTFVSRIGADAFRGRLMTIYQASFLFGMGLGPLFGGIIANLFDLRAPFIFIALISLCSSIWCIFRIPGYVGKVSADSYTINKKSTSKLKYLQLLKNQNFLAISTIQTSVFFTRGSALFLLFPLLAAEKFLLKPGYVGMLFTIPQISNLFTQPFVAMLIDKLDRKSMIIPAMILFCISLSISAISFHIYIFILGLIIYGIAQAIVAPVANAYIADMSTPEDRAVTYGVFRTFADFGIVFGAPIIGKMTDIFTVETALFSNVILLGLATSIFVAIAKKK
jgi:MFS family permease